jgi:hypothetical protein
VCFISKCLKLIRIILTNTNLVSRIRLISAHVSITNDPRQDQGHCFAERKPLNMIAYDHSTYDRYNREEIRI